MAATSNITEKVYEPKTGDRAIKKIYKEETTDICFSFSSDGSDGNKQKIRSHKALLSALSTVFDAMFTGNWKESTEVEIVDASFGTFKEFIQYFYSEKVTIREENVGELINLANKYELLDLFSVCASFLLESVTVDNVMDWIALACTFDLDELKTNCKDIVSKHTEQVIESESFLRCNNNTLFEILSIDKSTCPEEKIFDACINWAQNQCNVEEIDAGDAKNIRRLLGSCFDRIRFKDMRIEEFSKRSSLHKNLFTVDEVFDLFAVERDDYNTRYRYRTTPYIFLFKKSAGEEPPAESDCEATQFRLSRRMRLKSFYALEEFWSQANANCNRCCIQIRIEGESIGEYFVRRAALHGMYFFEFEIGPIFEKNVWYSLDFGDISATNLFLVTDQTVHGVDLDVCPGDSSTIISAIYFEECDETT